MVSFRGFSVVLALKILVFCLLSDSVLGQVNDGTPCYTPKEEYGLCISIKQCKVLINLLISQGSDPAVANYLRSSTCGYSGNTPMVCCPQGAPRINPTVIEAEPNKDKDKPENKPDISENEGRKNQDQLLSPPACGFTNKTNTKIVGGVPVTLGEFPWMVALGYKNPKNPNTPKWLCGGTLITDRHILTAAHCVHNRNDLYLARVGEHDLYDDNDGASPEDIPLVKAKIHENYSAVQFTNDIAILTLERKAKNDSVWPVCLPHEEPLRSNTFLKYRPLVTGWGSIYFNGPSSSVLQVTSIPVVDNSNCVKAFANKSVIDDRIICAGWTTGGKDSCRGDSGGPLMYGKTEPNNLRYYQIGVVSYGFRCAEAGYPGVYTRVTNFIDWIKRNLD